MKSHPGGGSSPSKAKDRKMSDQCSPWKAGTRKSFSDSFGPDQGGALSTLHGSDSGKYQHLPNTLMLLDDGKGGSRPWPVTRVSTPPENLKVS